MIAICNIGYFCKLLASQKMLIIMLTLNMYSLLIVCYYNITIIMIIIVIIIIYICIYCILYMFIIIFIIIVFLLLLFIIIIFIGICCNNIVLKNLSCACIIKKIFVHHFVCGKTSKSL